MLHRSLILVAFLAAPAGALAADLPIPVVAAEGFYGEVAAAVGGDRVTVDTVAMSPDADPHDFSPPPSVARSVADAGLVIINGLDYDHWMEHLLEASPDDARLVVDVSSLVGAQPGGNPHLWYDPRTIPALAGALAADFSRLDPAGADQYRQRVDAYLASLKPLDEKVAAIRGRFAGTEVVASEPVFGLMAEALGLKMLGEDFQHAIMNETEPSARSIAEVEDDLRSGRAKVLFYNSQVVDPLTERLLAAANDTGVPVVAVTESMPIGDTYAGWMLDQLEATAKALAAPAS